MADLTYATLPTDFMESHRYLLFGLTVASHISLPGLPLAPEDCATDVWIDHGVVPAARQPEPIGLYITDGAAVLNVPEAGRFLIADGRRITVEPSPGATERNVRLYLLGSAFGAVLHQRGLLPLHANTIDFDGVAVAFMGHSGAGKSTLAAWFHDRGLPVLGDDVCVVRDDEAGRAVVETGIPRVRLWGDALRASGRVATDYEMSFEDMDKYDVPLAVTPATNALPLAAIYTLRAAEPGTAGAIDRLSGIEAVEALVANTYRGGYVPLMNGVEAHLGQCLSLARRVPVFSLRRRWGLDVFAEEAAQVDTHVRGVLAGRA